MPLCTVHVHATCMQHVYVGMHTGRLNVRLWLTARIQYMTLYSTNAVAQAECGPGRAKFYLRTTAPTYVYCTYVPRTAYSLYTTCYLPTVTVLRTHHLVSICDRPTPLGAGTGVPFYTYTCTVLLYTDTRTHSTVQSSPVQCTLQFSSVQYSPVQYSNSTVHCLLL